MVEALSNYRKSYFWGYGNPTYGDATGSPAFKKSRLMYFLDLFERFGEKEQCALVCLERLWMIGLTVVMLISYSHVVSVVLVFSRVGPVLRSRYGAE